MPKPIAKLDIPYLRGLNPPIEASIDIAEKVNELVELANAGLLGAKIEHAGPEDRPSQPIAGEKPGTKPGDVPKPKPA
jgi:hypothetical protein